MDDAAGIDAEEVAVVGEVVDRAQRDAVDDRRVARRISVLDDVRGLEQRRLSEAADRAVGRVGAQHSRPEPVLVQPHDRFARGVAPDVFAGDETGGRRVGERQGGLQFDELRVLIDGDDEGRCATAYWPDAMPRKWITGTASSCAATSARLSAAAWSRAAGVSVLAARKR